LERAQATIQAPEGSLKKEGHSLIRTTNGLREAQFVLIERNDSLNERDFLLRKYHKMLSWIYFDRNLEEETPPILRFEPSTIFELELSTLWGGEPSRPTNETNERNKSCNYSRIANTKLLPNLSHFKHKNLIWVSFFLT